MVSKSNYSLGNEEARPKCVIGDNLSSHLNVAVIESCDKEIIRFVFLPLNATHLCHPLDVGFCRPMNIAWRKILTDYKQINRASRSLEKSQFSRLSKVLLNEIASNAAQIIRWGFRKCGIVLVNGQEVLSRISGAHQSTNLEKRVNDTLLVYLQACR